MAPVEIKSFTVSYPGRARVLVTEVLISKAFTPNSEKIDPKERKAQQYKAIWDTGADGTVITQRVVDECDLRPIGVVTVKTTKGSFKTNSYLVNVWLPNRFMAANVEACQGDVEGGDVLIGMNIINRGDFAVTNKDGKTVFSFRMPSVERIDFVENPFKPKPSRTIPSRKRHQR